MAATSLLPARLGDHVGWAFDDDAELNRYSTRFAATGLRRGYTVPVLTAGRPPGQVPARLRETVAGFAAAEKRTQVEVLAGEEVQRDRGHFAPERTIAAFQGTIDRAVRAGFPGMWACADRSWVGGVGAGQLAIAEVRGG